MSDFQATVDQRDFAYRVVKGVGVKDVTQGVNLLMKAIEKLSVEFPPHVWCAEAATFVIAESNTIPAPSKLKPLLTKFLARVRAGIAASSLAIPIYPAELERSGLTSEERHWAASWLGHEAAKDLPAGHLDFYLELRKNYHPRAFEWLCENNIEAASIAVSKGWKAGRGEWTEGTIARSVANIMAPLSNPAADAAFGVKRAFFLRLMRILVEKQAPHLAHLVPVSGMATDGPQGGLQGAAAQGWGEMGREGPQAAPGAAEAIGADGIFPWER